MRKLLSILLLLASYASFSQGSITPNTVTVNNWIKLPADTLNTAPIGAFAQKGNITWLKSSTGYWKQASGADSATLAVYLKIADSTDRYVTPKRLTDSFNKTIKYSDTTTRIVTYTAADNLYFKNGGNVFSGGDTARLGTRYNAPLSFLVNSQQVGYFTGMNGGRLNTFEISNMTSQLNGRLVLGDGMSLIKANGSTQPVVFIQDAAGGTGQLLRVGNSTQTQFFISQWGAVSIGRNNNNALFRFHLGGSMGMNKDSAVLTRLKGSRQLMTIDTAANGAVGRYPLDSVATPGDVAAAVATAAGTQNLQQVTTRGDSTGTRIVSGRSVKGDSTLGLIHISKWGVQIGDSVVRAMDTIIMYGNSITANTFFNSTPGGGYANKFTEITNTTLVNRGIGGTKMVNGTPGDSAMEERIYTIPIYSPGYRYITFSYGVNDAHRTVPDTVSFKTAYAKVIDTCIARGWPLNKIVVLVPTYWYDNASYFTSRSAYASAAKYIAIEKGVPYVDMYNAFLSTSNPQSLIMPDSVHPNQAGMALMAKTAITALNATVEPRLVANGRAFVGDYMTVGSQTGTTSRPSYIQFENTLSADTVVSQSKLKFNNLSGIGISSGSVDYYSGQSAQKHTFYGPGGMTVRGTTISLWPVTSNTPTATPALLDMGMTYRSGGGNDPTGMKIRMRGTLIGFGVFSGGLEYFAESNMKHYFRRAPVQIDSPLTVGITTTGDLLYPSYINLGTSKSITAGADSATKLRLCGPKTGFGVSGTAGLEYFSDQGSGSGRHTFYGNVFSRNSISYLSNFHSLYTSLTAIDKGFADSAYVGISGNQSIAGTKTFSGQVVMTNTPSGTVLDSVLVKDINGNIKQRTISSVLSGPTAEIGDINTSVTYAGGGVMIKLPTITSNRTLTLPTIPQSGVEIHVHNKNTAAFTWAINNAVDAAGNAVSSLANSTVYTLIGDTTSQKWVVSGKYTMETAGYTVTTATDANYTMPIGAFATLPVITANRTITLPSASSYPGAFLFIWNRNNNASFKWTFSGTVVDKSNNTVTDLVNTTVYRLLSNGSAWLSTTL